MSDSDRNSDAEIEVRKKPSKKAKTSHGEEPTKKKARRSKYIAAEDEEMTDSAAAATASTSVNDEELPPLETANGVKEKKQKKKDEAATVPVVAAEPPADKPEEKKESSSKHKKSKKSKEVSSDEEEEKEEKKEKPKASKKRKAEAASSSDEDDKDSSGSDSDSGSGSGSDSDGSNKSSSSASGSDSGSDSEEEKKEKKPVKASKSESSKEKPKDKAEKKTEDKKSEDKKNNKKKKKKAKKEGSSDDSDSGSGSSSDSDSSSSEAEDDGLMTTYTPGASKSIHVDIPAGTSFLNPNNTLRFHSIKYNLNVHYTQIDPTKHLKLHESKPKAGFSTVFYAITSLKQQKFCFSGTGAHLKTSFDRAIVVGPFSVAKYPRMWPYGDRDATPGQQFAPPGHPSKIKYRLPLHNDEYSPELSVQKKDVGSVDPDSDKFMSEWVRRKFDKWKEDAAWKCASRQFPNALKAATAKLAEAEDKALADYKEAKEKYKKDKKKYTKEKKKNPNAKKPSEPSKPKTDTGEKALKAAFLSRFDRSIVSKDERGFDHINYSKPLFRTQTKKERDTNVQPQLFNDSYYKEQFYNPPEWEDKKEKKLKPGFPLVPIDLPMLRVVTLDEAMEMKAKGKEWKDPYRLVPLKNRFIISDDIVAPVLMFDKYDIATGAAGWRFEVVAVIWLGEKGALDEKAAARAPSHKELDPTSYFLVGQKYTRTAGTFDPVTVESSRFSRAREAAAAAAAAASSSPDYGDVPPSIVNAANIAYQNGEYSGFLTTNGTQSEQPDEHGIYPSDVQ